MRIAHLLPYTAHFPLEKHNGRYEWALRLATLQAERGHLVTIFAAPGSCDNSGKIEWKSIKKDLGNQTANNKELIRSALQDEEYDIFHSHFDYLHYSLSNLTAKPILYTQHWFPNDTIAAAAQTYPGTNVFAVPPTHYLANKDRELGIRAAEVIYHGIDLDLFKPVKNPSAERLIFIGRITPAKGVLEAVRIASKANQALDIVGKINSADEAYWQKIKPYVDGKKIAYLGPKSLSDVAGLLQQAKAFIFPSQAPEAFGQITIESQACGTPVIISSVGAGSELVEDKKSGFVVASEAQYLNAIAQIDSIDRNYCRSFAEQFDIQIMVEKYDRLYGRLTDPS